MSRTIEISFLFNYSSPPCLMYSIFDSQNGQLYPEGISLANGEFLINRVLKPGDEVHFGLYELFPIEGDPPRNRPSSMVMSIENFHTGSMFDNDRPHFRQKDFLKTPVKIFDPIGPNDLQRPFPGIEDIWRWSTRDMLEKSYRVRSIEEDQTFTFIAQTTVVPESGNDLGGPLHLARSFRVDPEMVVGPSEVPNGADPGGEKP